MIASDPCHNALSPTHGSRSAHIRALAERFGLATLRPSIEACEALAGATDVPLDVAVFGQFKSGKSSLLNAVLGRDVLPVGVVPVTAIVTRVTAGPAVAARVTYLDGSVESIMAESIADFVAESRNPHNRLRVSLVDVFTPALADLRGLRLVDTPGLGSIFTHNTQSTRDWLPQVAVAIVAVSADRPLSSEDRQLIAELRPHAPRIVVVLTKVDLLAVAEREEVRAFLREQLTSGSSADIPILFFSTREQPAHWVARLKDDFLRPLAVDAYRERQRTLTHKLDALTHASREYLSVALHAAEQAEADRQRLAVAVLDESTHESVIRDELALAAERLVGSCRPAIEKRLADSRQEITRRLTAALSAEMANWGGHLAKQTARYQSWMRAHLLAELEPASRQASPAPSELLAQAEVRFRRVVEAFRDRLSRNLSREIGVTLSPVAWHPVRPPFVSPPVAVSQTFMIHWDLLWWLIPMRLVAPLFRRHCTSRVGWEVEKNLGRLTSDWCEATRDAITDLERQAAAWAHEELTTLTHILAQRPEQVAEIRAALANLAAPKIS